MAKFRFQDLEIWRSSIDIAGKLLVLQTALKRKTLQTRRAAHGLRNDYVKQHCRRIWLTLLKGIYNSLNIARRSTCKNANISILLERHPLISKVEFQGLLDKLDKSCHKITSFQRSLKRDDNSALHRLRALRLAL